MTAEQQAAAALLDHSLQEIDRFAGPALRDKRVGFFQRIVVRMQAYTCRC